LGGFFLQLKEKLMLNRQGGSLHTRKHIEHASRCRAYPASRVSRCVALRYE
jgi:hypothetical protein